MGMYTELVLAVELQKDVERTAIDTLEFMLGQSQAEPDPLPDHPFFKTERWQSMLQSDSGYFPGDTMGQLRFDELSQRYFLTVRCNFKNYGGELAHFLDWLHPLCRIRSESFVGYSRFEENEAPTLIYFQEGRVVCQSVWPPGELYQDGGYSDYNQPPE